MVCKILKIPPGQVSELHVPSFLSCQEAEPRLFLQHRSHDIALGFRSKCFMSAICDLAALQVAILESGLMTNTNSIFNLELSYG